MTSKGVKHQDNIAGSKKKIGEARGRRNFTKPERKRMVDVLALNDWNYSLTHKKLSKEGIKIGISTLKKYRKEFEDQIENLPAKYITGWEETFAKSSSSLIKKQLTLHELVVDKLLELVPKVNSIRSMPTLINALTVLNNATQSGINKEGSYDKAASLIQQINNHLTKQDEQKSKSAGDIQDVPFEPVE